MSLAAQGNKNKNKNKKKTGGKPNPVGFTVKKKKSTEDDTSTEVVTNNSTEESTDTSTEEEVVTGTDNSTVDSTDISSLLRQQLAPAKKKGKKKQISAWVDEDVYKAFTKYKGNGEKGQKSELINKLLKMAFDIKDE